MKKKALGVAPSEKLVYLEPYERQELLKISNLVARIKRIEPPEGIDRIEFILNSEDFSDDDKNVIVLNLIKLQRFLEN